VSAPAIQVTDLDAIYVRHPMAQRLLSFRDGLLWATGWALLASLGAYLFESCVPGHFPQPVASGSTVLPHAPDQLSAHHAQRGGQDSGGIAAVFAVHPNPPSGGSLMVLFLWLFCW